ncbi:MAG: DUF1080 domain-containing protein [Bacillota bacterium]
MKPVASLFGVGVLIVLLCGAVRDEGRWAVLFDGKTLDGWTTLQGEPVVGGWRAEDGALHLKGKGGDIYSVREYANFILEFEFKLATNTNSGVKYRMMYYGEVKEYLGPEYQILDDQNTEEGKNNPKGTTASIYVLFACNDKKMLKPVGEWNQGRIVAKGTKIEHWLNGEKVAEADTATAEWKKAVAASKFAKYPTYGQNASGRVMLQDHGTEVWYRNIRVQVLP